MELSRVPSDMAEILDQANGIASRSLTDCFTDDGIIAGKHHFVDLWARDSLFASLGALSMNRADAVKTTLQSFLRFQRSDGLIPYRILRSPTSIAKYRGNPSYYEHPLPDFRSHNSGGLVLDGGLMTVIVADRYIRATGDEKFLEARYSSLKAALGWYDRSYRGGMLWECGLCANGQMRC